MGVIAAQIDKFALFSRLPEPLRGEIAHESGERGDIVDALKIILQCAADTFAEREEHHRVDVGHHVIENASASFWRVAQVVSAFAVVFLKVGQRHIGDWRVDQHLHHPSQWCLHEFFGASRLAQICCQRNLRIQPVGRVGEFCRIVCVIACHVEGIAGQSEK